MKMRIESNICQNRIFYNILFRTFIGYFYVQTKTLNPTVAEFQPFQILKKIDYFKYETVLYLSQHRL